MGDFYTFDEPQKQKHKHKHKEKTIDFKLIIGVMLILISIALSIISNVITLGGIYRLNDNALQSSVFLLTPVVIMLILASLTLIGSKSKRGRNFLIFSILALLLNISNISTSIREVQAESLKEKVAIEKVKKLVKDFVAERKIILEDVSQEKYGKTAPLIEAIQDNYLNFQKIRKDINSIDEIIKDPINLFQESIKEPASIKEKITTLEQTSKDILNLDNEVKEYTEKFKDDLADVYISGGVKDEIMTNLEYTVYTYAEIISRNLKYMNAAVISTKDMLSFIDEKQGAYRIKNDQIVFNEDQDEKEYKNLYKLFDQAVAENIWNYLHFTEIRDEKIKELEEDTQ